MKEAQEVIQKWIKDWWRKRKVITYEKKKEKEKKYTERTSALNKWKLSENNRRLEKDYIKRKSGTEGSKKDRKQK